MEQKKIHPYLIDEKRMAGYYELLLEDKFTLKLFEKKKDKGIYDYFLPIARSFMFWTFDLNFKEDIDEYKEMDNDLKAAVCSRYTCNIFEKGNDRIVCFNTGICFAITDDIKTIKKVTKYEQGTKMELINLRSEDYYVPKDEKEQHLYAYIMELYKLIYLKLLNKDIHDIDLFDKARNSFVKFTQDVYEVDITDKDSFCEKVEKELKMDSLYVMVENQFELLYKNNKMNENISTKRFLIIMLVVFIIIGIANLLNWLG